MASGQSNNKVLDVDYLVDAIVSNRFTEVQWDKSDPLIGERKIVISGKIHEATTKEVVEKLLYMNSIDKKLPIDIYLRTKGGWVDDAFSIIDTMSEISAPVNVHAMGTCESAGVLILISATGKRTAAVNSKIAPHFNQLGGKQYTEASVNRKRFINLYSKKTKVPKKWLDYQTDTYYYLDSKEALKFGLVDLIRKPQPQNIPDEKK